MGFQSEVKKLENKGFVLQECDYNYILEFYLQLVKKYANLHRQKSITKPVRDTRSIYLKESLNQRFVKDSFSQLSGNVTRKMSNKTSDFQTAAQFSGAIGTEPKIHRLTISCTCLVCKETFINKYVLLKHCKMKHKIDFSGINFLNVKIAMFKLDKWSVKTFDYGRSVKKKLLTTHPHSCLVCSKTSKNKRLMIKHYKMKHKVDLFGAKLLNIKISILKLDLRFPDILEFV